MHRRIVGCRVTLPPDGHIVAANDRQLFAAIECPKSKPNVDWKNERVFVANFMSQSNASYKWSAVRTGREVQLRLQTGFACQGARVVSRSAPVITVVNTGGLPLRYRLMPIESRACGNVP